MATFRVWFMAGDNADHLDYAGDETVEAPNSAGANRLVIERCKALGLAVRVTKWRKL